MKKVPMRMCVVTREKWPKKELVRIVKGENGVLVDLTGKVNGHGCYLKKDLEVIMKAKQSKILEKVLECEIPDSIYQELTKIL